MLIPLGYNLNIYSICTAKIPVELTFKGVCKGLQYLSKESMLLLRNRTGNFSRLSQAARQLGSSLYVAVFQLPKPVTYLASGPTPFQYNNEGWGWLIDNNIQLHCHFVNTIQTFIRHAYYNKYTTKSYKQ